MTPMTTPQTPQDRRQTPRSPAAALSVTLRPKGRIGSMTAEAVDFNRYGIAVRAAQALTLEQPVFLNLACEDVRVDQIVGIVHNCLRLGEAYRIGIRFRLNSPLQRDRPLIERQLSCLEALALGELRDPV